MNLWTGEQILQLVGRSDSLSTRLRVKAAVFKLWGRLAISGGRLTILC